MNWSMPPWSGDVVRGDGRALISRRARCARHDPSLFSNKWQYMHQKTLPVLVAQISFVFLFVHLLLAFSTLLLCRSVSDKWYQSRVFEGPRRRHDASAETPRPFTGQEG